MKVQFSDIYHQGPYTVFKVLLDKKGRHSAEFTIVSHSLTPASDFSNEDKIVGQINGHTLQVIYDTPNLIMELQLGNKCLNQLKLAQLGYAIPDTIALDFSFSTDFRKTGEIDLEELHKSQIAGQLGHTSFFSVA